MASAAVPALSPAWLALAIGLLPIAIVHLCYAISVNAGHVPLCLPYLEGCTSISRAARHGMANHVFKAAMLPIAGLMLVYWSVAAQWLRAQTASRRKRIAAMQTLGVIGALFLMLYATFLGVDGDLYRWLRRYGVTVYFSFTVLAQMLLASVLDRGLLRKTLIALCAAMLLMGLASIPLQHLLADKDVVLNALEWAYALLMSLAFAAVGMAWMRRRVRLNFTAPNA
ncbi:hypothetical protein [Panacagrimonas sp.]|uniref:hypothetical protein n=1 Tax=Panacagrimonas sp. TaxID=2480088 RepID=UPI003B524597